MSAPTEPAEPAETCKHCGAELPPKPAGVGGRRRLFCAGVADKCKILYWRAQRKKAGKA